MLLPYTIILAERANSVQAAPIKAIAPPSAPPAPYTFPRVQNGSIANAGASFISTALSAALSVFGLFASASTTIESIAIEDEDQTEIEPVTSFSQPAGVVDFDFDGDGKADVGRWNATATDFRVKNSTGDTISTYSIGTTSGKAAPADFDGDEKVDAAVFSAGSWTIRKSSDGQTTTISLGQSGDIPVPGDYDGDGTADLAVFRPSNSTWEIRKSTNPSNPQITSFGTSGDIPVHGDFDGDGKVDIAIFRPSTGYWWIQGSTAGLMTMQFGIATDIPVPADYDGDGKTDPAVFRPSNGSWYNLKSGDNYASFDLVGWGNYADQPVPGDYDGDGKADHAIWRPSTGVWHIKKSGSAGTINHGLGLAGDVAVPSAFVKQVGAGITPYQLAKERLKPRNGTGGTDDYSQNFGWGTSLVSLPGRAGLDMGFGMSYNSLVWTKEGNNIVFDTNVDNISPGFRFGFATIEPAYFVPGSGGSDPYWAYVMVTPSGGRVEFKQIGVTESFETTDSSYLSLKTKVAPDPNAPIEGINLTLRGTDGTQMLFSWSGGAFRCEQIKDRNGNYISIEHDEYGLLRKVTDTLGREVNVNYDTEFFPTTITQTWKADNGEGSPTTHTWATFSYDNHEVDSSFDSSLNVVGPPNEWFLKVLDKVTYADNSFTKFHYNGFVQVSKVENVAADTVTLNHVATDLDSPGTNLLDVPRFTQTRSFARNFDNDNETVVNFTRTASSSFNVGGLTGSGTLIAAAMAGHPYEAVTKTWFGDSGWNEGLPLATEDHAKPTVSGSVGVQRWTWTEWEQDDLSATEQTNPRVTETRVGDSVSTKKTQVDYLVYPSTSIAQFGLVSEARLYASDLSTILKKQQTDYNLTSPYLARRIIGLPSETRSYGWNDATNSLEFASKITYGFDESNFEAETNQTITPIRHDTTNFDDEFILGRGNLTSVTRHDVIGTTAAVTSQTRYDIAGSVVARLDPLGRKVRVEYADEFHDTTTSRNTFAYPTKVFDPAGNFSEVKYRFDIGANVWARSPGPQGHTYGKTTERLYDSIGRLSKETILNNGAYTRYSYPNNGVQSQVWTTLIDINNDGVDIGDEVYSESWSDGAGRTLRTRTELPDSRWAASVTEFDLLGRVKRTSVPTEVTVPTPTNPNSWAIAGDDATRGWLWNSREYDWMGRVTRLINSDSNGSDGKDQLIEYEGCGCAGSDIITAWSEMVPRDDAPETLARRGTRVHKDILGRAFKTESLNWTGGVYSTVMNQFDCRDQITRSRQHEGYWTNPRYQTTSATFDGHGRMISRHVPQQDPGTSTQYSYFADDRTATVTDARGALTEYTYDSRGLVEEIEYSEPTGSSESLIPIVPCDPGEPNCEYPFPQPTPPTQPSPTPTPTPGPTPGPTPATILVEFAYDNAGNRTLMSDPLGTTGYEYDDQSRLVSETRQFNDTLDTLEHAPAGNNSFELQYTYHLSGSLKSLTDPYGDTVYYAHDKAGRLDSVTGSSFAGVTNYASNPDYRAWGGLQSLTYGNGVSMSMTFDNRLRPDHYELKTVTTDIMKKNYEYNSDGNLKYVEDLLDGKFDRLQTFDHQGRIKEGKSGAEATGGTVAPEDMEMNLPYRQSYQFNEYGNMTQRDNMHWGVENWYGQTNNLAYAYYNDRIVNTGWEHDKDGRVTKSRWPDDGTESTYDSRGLLTRHFSWSPQNTEIRRFYDGDGREVKRNKTVYVEDPEATQYPFGEWVDEPPVYYIRSSVLGGAVVSETRPTGKKKKTFVTAAGTRLATQFEGEGTMNDHVNFEHSDASGMSHRSSTASTTILTGEGFDGSPAELDPMGGNAGVFSPYFQLNPGPIEPEIPILMQTGLEDMMMVNGQRVPCTLDGMTIGCGQARSMLESGSALPSSIAWAQHSPGFSFNSHGLGIFSVTLPDIFTNNSGRVWAQPHGTRAEGWRIFEGGTSIFAVNWGPQRQTQQFERRRVTSAEAEVLKESVTRAADNTELCRKYVKDLIERTAANAGKTVDDIVSTNIEALFDIVLGSRGGGAPKWGGIFLRESTGIHSAQNYWLWVGNPGFAEVNLGYGTGQGSILDRLGKDKSGIITIHELLHVAVRSTSAQTNDLAYAIAAADIAGVDPPIFSSDPTARVSQASRYWGERLNQACGFPSSVTNQMTDHKLYKSTSD